MERIKNGVDRAELAKRQCFQDLQTLSSGVLGHLHINSDTADKPSFKRQDSIALWNLRIPLWQALPAQTSSPSVSALALQGHTESPLPPLKA